MWKFVCLSAAFAVITAEQKVPVDVYYETLCPDSIAFVTNQLVPAYQSRLKDHMDLKLVPYGKSSYQRSQNGHDYEFKCHHGPVECYGNKVQSCILKQVPKQDDQIKYIDCLMKQAKNMRNEYPLVNCLNTQDWSTVTNCANNSNAYPNGNELLAQNGDKTAVLNPPLTSVPTIIFNRVFNKTEQDMAQTNFKHVLCSYIKNECPSECNAASSLTFSSLVAIFSFLVYRLL